MTKTIICSHGFGVKQDSYGMFPELAKALPEYNFKMFDYNTLAPNGDSTFRSLEEQGNVLQNVIDNAPDGEIILLCHSQGCLIPGFVALSRVSEVILLAAPDRMGSQRVIDRFKSRQGSILDLNGMSSIPRSDGSTTFIPKEYFESIDAVQPLELYEKIAATVPTIFIRALKDEIIGLTHVNEIKNAELIDIDSDHNFNGVNRQKLIEQLRSLL